MQNKLIKNLKNRRRCFTCKAYKVVGDLKSTLEELIHANTYRDCWLLTNINDKSYDDDNKIIDDWLDDCYDECYAPSSVFRVPESETVGGLYSETSSVLSRRC